jgi:adenosylcobinamide-GDP ribazoletransferase
LIALGFFTRVPVKNIPNFQSQWLNQASRYYGVVGLLVGCIGALVWQLSDTIWPPAIAVILSMITTVLLTGGFHEDGLADTWDGLGGGWTLEQKLTIMKDSRLGTYGALALILALLLKFQLLLSLAQLNITPMLSLNLVVIALLCGHCLSRVLAVSLIYNQRYVRDIDSSKIKPMTQEQSPTEIITLLLTGLIPLALLPSMLVLIVIATLIITRKLLVIWYNKQLGGYTGDLLGQAQQLSELVIYLTLLTYFTH